MQNMSGAIRKLAKATKKLYIGNLPWTVGNKEITEYFSQFGHVSTGEIIYDKTLGISRGYGFITFSTFDGYNNAVNKRIHHLEGRNLKIQPAHSNNDKLVK